MLKSFYKTREDANLYATLQLIKSYRKEAYDYLNLTEKFWKNNENINHAYMDIEEEVEGDIVVINEEEHKVGQNEQM